MLQYGASSGKARLNDGLQHISHRSPPHRELSEQGGNARVSIDSITDNYKSIHTGGNIRASGGAYGADYQRKKTSDSHLLKKNLMPFGTVQKTASNKLQQNVGQPFHSPQKLTRLPPLVQMGK